MFAESGPLCDRFAIRALNHCFENSATHAKKEGLSMKADSFGEIFLWNREVDRLIRVLQRMESIGILSKHEMKVYEVELEDVLAGLNADLAGRIAISERAHQSRLKRERTGW